MLFAGTAKFHTASAQRICLGVYVGDIRDMILGIGKLSENLCQSYYFAPVSLIYSGLLCEVGYLPRLTGLIRVIAPSVFSSPMSLLLSPFTMTLKLDFVGFGLSLLVGWNQWTGTRIYDGSLPLYFLLPVLLRWFQADHRDCLNPAQSQVQCYSCVYKCHSVPEWWVGQVYNDLRKLFFI